MLISLCEMDTLIPQSWTLDKMENETIRLSHFFWQN